MSNGARVAAAVASGYLLGRGKRLKLAIMVGGLIAGKRIATTPSGLLKQANDYVESNPELAKLSETARTTLMDSARRAAVETASGRIDQLSDVIRDRTQKLNDGFTELEADDGDQPDAEAEDEDESVGDQSDAEAESADEKPAKKPAKKSAQKPSQKSSPKNTSKSTSKTTSSGKKRASATKSSSSGTRAKKSQG